MVKVDSRKKQKLIKIGTRPGQKKITMTETSPNILISEHTGNSPKCQKIKTELLLKLHSARGSWYLRRNSLEVFIDDTPMKTVVQVPNHKKS